MTKNEARKKIKRHINSTCKINIEITEGKVWYWWRVLNIAVFDGKLRKPKRVLIKGKMTGGPWIKQLAWCEGKPWGDVTLGVHCIQGTQYEFLCVLAHEMVHQWEFQHGYAEWHGKQFFSWRQKLQERVNLPLSRKVRTSLQ